MSIDIQLNDEAAPDADSPAFGLLREQVLDAYLLQRPASIPAVLDEVLRQWADSVVDSAIGPGLGCDPAGMDTQIFQALRRAGMPFALNGSLQFGRDIISCDAAQVSEQDGHLLVPDAEQLLHMNSVRMRPLRRFIAGHFKMRLQAACDISCYLWSNQMLLISRQPVRVAGFVHGPEHGQRSSLALDPGGTQLFSWSVTA